MLMNGVLVGVVGLNLSKWAKDRVAGSEVSRMFSKPATQ